MKSDTPKDTAQQLLREQQTSALREQFIAVLSHDLRNPLAAIKAGTLLLKRDPARAQVAMRLIDGSVDRMAALIDNLMDFSRGRLGGGIALERRLHDLQPILQHIIDEVQIGTTGVLVATHFALPQPVNCDRRRIEQLLSNLLGNAVRYGSPGKPITVSAATRGDWLELFVANAGRAIDPARLAGIFEPFNRGESRPGLQGLGLGLYISQQVAQAHGGTLSVISTAAQTCFTLRMPLLNAAPDPACAEAPSFDQSAHADVRQTVQCGSSRPRD